MRLLDLLAEDRARGVWFVPVRHHSPACATHVQRIIETVQPKEVQIEGPEELTPLIPFILHEQTKAPFAAYCTGRVGRRRFGGYYPFCDYSPELVALRVGRSVGATLRFVDLTYTEQVRVSKDERGAAGLEVESLLSEGHLRRSRYLDEVARRTGCRDHDELWDHLFEVRGAALESSRFVDEVAVYCATSRAEYGPAALAAEGNIAREARMGAFTADAIKRGALPVVVVTGGFHTVALPEVVRGRPRLTKAKRVEAPTLMRYSFDQLDALNGYGAGMCSPAWYDAVWRLGHRERAAAEILVELGRATRKKKLGSVVSTAQVLDAQRQALALAALRGRAGPTREDVLDAVRSCFVKGPLDAEGSILMAEVKRALAGTKVGVVVAEAGSPPLVVDFHRLCKELRVDVSSAAPRETTLDLYRKSKHRDLSRFFHALSFLDVPFAELSSGPDFVTGEDVDRIVEKWRYAFSPAVESALVERVGLGATITEAATSRLIERTLSLEKQGRARSASAAVRLLSAACRMGAVDRVDRICAAIEGAAHEDGSLKSLTSAIHELLLLWHSREPLEAFRIEALPELCTTLYLRAVYLVDSLEEEDAVSSMSAMRALLVTERFDSDLFHDALERRLLGGGTREILGAAAAFLFLAGRVPADRLVALAVGHLTDSAFLRGALSAAREIAWRVPELLEAISGQLSIWSEEEFLKVLPELRLCFADLTPRETDRVAHLIFEEPPDLAISDVSAEDAAANLQQTGTVRRLLERDHLKAWS